MFNNIGRKIKIVAKVFFWIGVLISIIIPLVSVQSVSYSLNGYQYRTSGNNILAVILFIVIGILISWLSTIILYGFGELIERVTGIDDKITTIMNHSLDKEG